MKRFIYYLILTCVLVLAALTTISAISNISLFGINQGFATHTSQHYFIRSIDFDYKTEAIAAFKSNEYSGPTAI
ncbi:MAG: hypothetical protein GX972_08545 [Amphibacillus sp.]|nr:hypothetical protein [Amphibacillus sp.]